MAQTLSRRAYELAKELAIPGSLTAWWDPDDTSYGESTFVMDRSNLSLYLGRCLREKVYPIQPKHINTEESTLTYTVFWKDLA